MKTEHVVCKSNRRRKVLLGLACFAAGLIPVVSYPILANAQATAASQAPAVSQVPAANQAAAMNPAKKIDDTWQGTLHTSQRDLRLVAKITRTDAGALKVTMYSIDQGGQGISSSAASFQDGELKFSIDAISGTYDGKMSGDGKSIAGTWTQGPNPLSLLLERATPETEWTIPPPPPPVKPMALDANPSFEVATIKPSTPNRPGKGFGFRGTQFITINTNLNDLIAFAYGLHAKQIVDAPAWFDTDLYDIVGVPDVPGQPNLKQMGVMVQKLLADRFKLQFHHDKRELSVYAISVAGGGPKMTKSTAAPNDPQGFGFVALGDLTVRNMSMADFATWMQSGVMDRPVVDQTGLTDRYDFKLKWTPDQSQFAQFRTTGAVVPPATDDPKAPPGLYTAVQEQLGLKMESKKAPDDVIVIDHVEKASAN
jgi:uncharacterized protein (TIGR03435 family)